MTEHVVWVCRCMWVCVYLICATCVYVHMLVLQVYAIHVIVWFKWGPCVYRVEPIIENANNMIKYSNVDVNVIWVRVLIVIDSRVRLWARIYYCFCTKKRIEIKGTNTTPFRIRVVCIYIDKYHPAFQDSWITRFFFCCVSYSPRI